MEGQQFPKAISVNRGILDTILDDEFRKLVNDEARRPEPTAAHVSSAFEQFIRSKLAGQGLIVLKDLELVFSYHLELNLLRTLAAHQDRILLLLPGKRERGGVILFPDFDHGSYTLSANLIADNNKGEGAERHRGMVGRDRARDPGKGHSHLRTPATLAIVSSIIHWG